MAEKVSTVSAGTIRRIAGEFVDAAKIGATITLEGHTLPLRPASAILFRGGQGHNNSTHTCFAISLLNMLIGSADVPGGTLGWPPRSLGIPSTGRLNFSPESSVDGMLSVGRWMIAGHSPWPVQEPKFPQTLSLQDFFTMATMSPYITASDRDDVYGKFGIDSRIEMVVSFGLNPITSIANTEIQADFYSNTYNVVFELFNNEFTEGFADIVLPDICYLETMTWYDGQGFFFNYPFGMEDWHYHLAQPVVAPKKSRRYFLEVLFDVLHRIGKLDRLNDWYNKYYDFDEENRIKPDEKLAWKELGDRVLKWYFGPDKGLDYFQEHGFVSWPKRIEEAYWRYFVDGRAPIYLEFLIDAGEKMKEIANQVGLEINWEQYTPFISWFPCPPEIQEPRFNEFDLYCFSYRDILHTGSTTMEIPYIDECSQMNPYTYFITINTRTAREHGLSEGETVKLITPAGREVEGQLRLMQGIHPRCIGIAACSGHWARGLPIAKGKGTNFDILLEQNTAHFDPISLNLETCTMVKIEKV